MVQLLACWLPCGSKLLLLLLLLVCWCWCWGCLKSCPPALWVGCRCCYYCIKVETATATAAWRWQLPLLLLLLLSDKGLPLPLPLLLLLQQFATQRLLQCIHRCTITIMLGSSNVG